MEMREKEIQREESVQLTLELIEKFLEDFAGKGRREVSLKNYRVILLGFYRHLPEDKRIDRETARQWRDWLVEQGYSERTVNNRVSVLNCFMAFLGRREWQMVDFYEKGGDVQPELSRREYLRLLKAAKNVGREKYYLLIKTLGGAGVRINELSQVTVEAVKQGVVGLECHNRRRILRVPTVLQKELLAFAEREGIEEGSVFLSQDGYPLSRSTIWYIVSSIGQEAGVEEEKASPRCLWQMYQRTYSGIQSNIEILAAQAYDRMMEEEQLEVGWK